MIPDLSIIIVNWNTKELLHDCIDSVLSSKPKVNYEIVVVDNGSADSSAESLEVYKKKLKIKIINNKENLGYAKANNQAIKISSGKYKLLLNSDTRVQKDSIDSLIDFANDHPDAGVIGSRLLNSDGSIQESCYRFPTLFSAIKEHWFGEKNVFQFAPTGDNPVKVDVVVGASFLITPKAIEKVGYLNERYFFFFEDLDYCRSVKKAGLSVFYLPKSRVIHLHGSTIRKMTKEEHPWKKLIPGSKTYHGVVMHYLITVVIWSGQKFGGFMPLFLIALLTIPAVASMLRPGYFIMQDDLQAFRVYEMNKCYADFQIPCRWVPDAGYQYGYPQFNYYPPLPYYIGAGMVRLGIQNIDSVKILFILGYILSAWTMYLLAKELFDKWSGFVSALLYTYIPYKAVEVYVRGALSEFWAQIFFPLILWAVYKLIKTGKNKYLIWMSVSIFFLMTTHTLMTMIFAPVAIILALFWLFQNKWQNFAKVLSGGILGFGLSAFFVLPVLFERQFAHVESLLSGYFDYRQHFVSLYKLFVSREWGYGSSGFPNEKLNLSLGIIQWVTGLVIAPIVALINIRKKKLGILTLILFGVGLLSIFMIHMKSSFIWAGLPPLWYMQFPWRFLALAIFLLCLLSGVSVFLSGKYKYIVGMLLILTSFALTANYFVPKDWLNISDGEKFSGQSWQKQLTISIFDYLPIYATLPPWQKAPDLPEVLQGKVSFDDYKKGSDYQEGAVDASQISLIRLPLFDFPGMKVKIDGNVVSHVHDNCTGERYCLGLITFSIPIGKHTIEARLTNTPARTAGNIVTLISLAAIFSVFFINRRDEKAHT